MLKDHQLAALRVDDLQLASGQSRLRTTADWVVTEACADAPPCLVLGADGDGMRGAACVFEPLQGTWRLLQGIRLPAATLLLAEVVHEAVRDDDAPDAAAGAEAPNGGGTVEAIHVMDAAMICGDDIRRLPFAERHRRLGFFVDALNRDVDCVVNAHEHTYGRQGYGAQGSLSSADDAWAAVDRVVNKARGRAGAPAGPGGATTTAPSAPSAPSAQARAMARRECDRVRLKKTFGLHQIADAVNAGRQRLDTASPTDRTWATRGILLFPGNANPRLPLEPPQEWKKEFSKSQNREYWFNFRTGASVWDTDRKSRPLSFQKCAVAMLRWDRRSQHPNEATLIEMAAAVELPRPPPP